MLSGKRDCFARSWVDKPSFHLNIFGPVYGARMLTRLGVWTETWYFVFYHFDSTLLLIHINCPQLSMWWSNRTVLFGLLYGSISLFWNITTTFSFDITASTWFYRSKSSSYFIGMDVTYLIYFLNEFLGSRFLRLWKRCMALSTTRVLFPQCQQKTGPGLSCIAGLYQPSPSWSLLCFQGLIFSSRLVNAILFIATSILNMKIFLSRMFVDALDAQFYDEHQKTAHCYLSLSKVTLPCNDNGLY